MPRIKPYEYSEAQVLFDYQAGMMLRRLEEFSEEAAKLAAMNGAGGGIRKRLRERLRRCDLDPKLPIGE